MKNQEKISSTLSGIAGEYFVAAELTRRGYLASITLRNSQGVDVLASNPDASRAVGIQVKTSQYAERWWLLSSKAEVLRGENLYYVFVTLGQIDERPAYHVVPSTIVAEHVLASHKTWLSKPKRDGTPRKDTSMREFHDPKGDFLERWDLLGLHPVTESASALDGSA